MVVGALGVWLGYPLADPIVGLLITIAIFGIVWQSARAVLTRSLDGVEPGITEEIRHAATHVKGIIDVLSVKARRIGHKLHAELAVAVDPTLSVAAAGDIAATLEGELKAHLPSLSDASIQFARRESAAPVASGHHHAPEPFRFSSRLASGALAIVDTAAGERFRLTLDRDVVGLAATVLIDREGGTREQHRLMPVGDGRSLEGSTAPCEPHEFSADLKLSLDADSETLPFRMTEPEGHHH